MVCVCVWSEREEYLGCCSKLFFSKYSKLFVLYRTQARELIETMAALDRPQRPIFVFGSFGSFSKTERLRNVDNPTHQHTKYVQV